MFIILGLSSFKNQSGLGLLELVINMEDVSVFYLRICKSCRFIAPDGASSDMEALKDGKQNRK